MSIKFDAEDKTLTDILMGKEKYRIPRYQRPYSWTIDEVSDLWNDLKEKESVFLGSFVFNYEKYNEDGFVEVIDGQQRLITLTILMAVLRDLYRDLGEERKSNKTQEIIAHTHPITLKEDYRLRCGDTLNKFFSENIQKENSDILLINPKNKEEKSIRENYKFLKDKINDELKNHNDKTSQIKFIDDLKQQIFDFKIIWIKIENEDDAYSIFETVNARGADLTSADLLKNYLLSKLPKKEDGIDVAKETWLTIENNVESARGALNVSKFIRYFWLSKYSFVPEKRLYKEVKKMVADPSSFLSDILKASEYYYKIASEKTGVDDWVEDFEDKRISQRIFDSLSSLRVMGVTQCYALLFCLLLNRDKINFDFSDIFKVIGKYHFAYSAVCKLSGNVVERLYYNTSKELQNAFKISDSNKRTKEIQKALSNFKTVLVKEHYPKRNIFIEKFMDIEYKNYPLIIYILSNIERAMGTADEKIINFTKVNIEHILPQDPKMWNLKKVEIREYVNKLGNLTLISKKINGPMGNKPLKEKMSLFSNSELNINKDLYKKFENLEYKWGEKEINNRQEELAKFAYDKVWKF